MKVVIFIDFIKTFDRNTVDTMFTAIDLLPFEELWLE